MANLPAAAHHSFMYTKLIACAILVLAASSASAAPNVLFIAIDDQNDWIGCLEGHPQVKTPAIDALAASGTLFTNAHCQAPLCNPSRSSLLTGLRPSTTGIYGLAPGIRAVEATKKQRTLPQTFTEAGYYTFTCGKIYHDGSLAPADRAREFNTWGPSPGMPKPAKRFAKLPGKPHPLMDWGPFPERDEENADWKIASAAVEAIEKAPKEKPFFIACGFRLPHVPCFASQKWFDLYPLESLKLPPVKADDRADLPKFADYLHWKLPEPRLKTLQENDEWKPLVRAYLASISFMDSQVGRVLAALDKSGRADDTLVVLWGDHGWHLGEKGITGKNTLWERSTRVPLVIRNPHSPSADQTGSALQSTPKIENGSAAPAAEVRSRRARTTLCSQPVELLDIFPTLLELCELPARKDLEGHSLVPLLKDPQAERPWPAITTHNQGNHAIRTAQWRYIRYADGSEELYNEAKDPNEWTNLAGDARYAATKRELAKWLPKADVPPAPGSAHRVLTYDPKSGEVTWEGKVIEKDAPLPGP
jgi:arylsulfatase A-like enzyme